MSALKADDVARYLRDNPVFFEEYAELLTEIHGAEPARRAGDPALRPPGRLPCATRRKRSKRKLAELIQFGEENDVISEKVHRLAVAMLSARDAADTVLHELYYNLREDFAVPHARLRLWRGDGRSAGVRAGERRAARRTPPGSSSRSAARTRTSRRVGWFGDAAPRIRSVAFIPLRELDETFGMLALASEDAARFYPEMGTLYLKRIGEMASAALLRFV